MTRSLYVTSDHHPRRSRPFEVEVGCREFVDKFTTRLANSGNFSIYTHAFASLFLCKFLLLVVYANFIFVRINEQ